MDTPDTEDYPLELWHQLVIDGIQAMGYNFSESLENYLVLTLKAFSTEHTLGDNTFAFDIFTASQSHHSQQHTLYRTLGDQCLILSGLFPEQALHRNVTLSYFTTLGQHAYSHAASSASYKQDSQLFTALCEHFVGLSDVLNTLRTPTQ